MSGDEKNFEIYLCSSGSDVASTEQLKILSHELDCLGLPTINVNVDILQQLIGSIHTLMSVYKKNVSEQKDLQLQITVIQSEKLSQQKLIETCNEKLQDKEDEIIKLKDTITKQNIEIAQLKETYKSTNKDFDALRSLLHRKEDEYFHTLNKLRLDNEAMKERLGEDVGKYRSQDSLAVEGMNKYKVKMAIYEQTIKKLQNNNEDLLNEILNLKEEIVMTLQNGDSSE